MSSKNIRILIVGGGSSGWMTAALLRQSLTEAEIVLVESSNIPTIGVGESTNRTMRYFQEAVGYDEKAFMRASNAAFKIAIRFENFNRLGGVFNHPFGFPYNIDDTLFKPNAAGRMMTSHLANQGNLFSKDCVYAYQLDAGLYGEYLKNECKRRGRVEHIVDQVRGVELTEDGEIARIQTAEHGPLTADLYIDCSGFRSILLGKALNEPFHSYNRFLLNDRAIAARVPYIDKERELKTYTNCVALSAGWVWNIPLWSRIGTGYVYCSEFLSRDEAESEYREFLGRDRVSSLNFNHLDIRTGRHSRAWVKNCVAVGISYGFLEPLESTGLSLTQLSIFDLARAISSGLPRETVSAAFNHRQAELFDTTRDFVMAHYVLTTRADTPYWKHILHDCELPETLTNILNKARAGSYQPIDDQEHKFYQVVNWNLILSGMGLFGQQPLAPPRADLSMFTNHARFLGDNIYDGDYDEPFRDIPFQSGTHPSWYPTW